jgi:metallo-beta-lactamase class B
MRSLAVGIAIAVVLATGASAGTAQTAPPTIDGLVRSAKSAAGLDWAGTFLRLCIPPPAAVPGAAGPGGGGAGRAAGPPARETWYAEPAKVADNLYFLGTRFHHAWAVVGSEGIILIEALFDYATEAEIIEGMRKLGLDINQVKYVLISHAHGDHDGGARLLQDAIPGVRLVYGAEDWGLVENATNRPGGTPRRDMVGTDGMTISVGDASVQIVTMPGHTLGTLSFLFEVRDYGRPMRVAYVGGTAIPFNGEAAYYDRYIASSRKLAQAADAFGATALLSNHTEFDNGFFKAHTAASRMAGERNPFEVGSEGVARYFTVVQNCTTAAKLRAADQSL